MAQGAYIYFNFEDESCLCTAFARLKIPTYGFIESSLYRFWTFWRILPRYYGLIININLINVGYLMKYLNRQFLYLKVIHIK